MAFQYQVNLKHVDGSGNTKLQKTLAGSHRLSLSGMQASLDVSLEEIPDPSGGPPTFRLTLTDGAEGPRNNTQGIWPYEIFFSHQDKQGAIRQSVVAMGSHFVQVNPGTQEMEVALDELAPRGNLNPRLHFTLREK
jgi:hypothetical protein